MASPANTISAPGPSANNEPVTVCHSATENIKDICREADIIIAALGRPGFVTSDMVKTGAVIIDVGTTRVPDATRKSGFRLRGDVDFDNVASAPGPSANNEPKVNNMILKKGESILLYCYFPYMAPCPARSVFFISEHMVIGPTPPGTGVI